VKTRQEKRGLEAGGKGVQRAARTTSHAPTECITSTGGKTKKGLQKKGELGQQVPPLGVCEKLDMHASK